MSFARANVIAVLVCVAVSLIAETACAGGIYPPAKGKELPQVYFDQIAKDAQSYTLKHAYLGLLQKTLDNRGMLAQGQITAMEAESVGGLAITGTKSIPVLTGRFANSPDPPPVLVLQQTLFDGPPSPGTMSDYYQEVSYGLFDVDGTVSDWFTVSNNDTYYEGSAGCHGLSPSCGARVGEFLYEVLVANDPSIDFALYDNDGPDGTPNSGDDDGYVDFVAFVHSESGGECPGDLSNIWSHKWVYSAWPWSGGQPYVTDDMGAGGDFIRVEDYSIQPSWNCSYSGGVEIGVFCHEFGHALGLPDLYDTNGGSHGIGYWGLMGKGSWGGDGSHPDSPSHMCAWSKEQLGWITPTVVRSPRTVSLSQVETNPQAAKIWEDAHWVKAYFLLENRQKTGFDQYLTGPGILIWHIDTGVTTWNDSETHKYVDLEEADGLEDLDHEINAGDAGDPFPGSSVNRTFDGGSDPNSDDYYDLPTGVACVNISNSGPVMTVDCTPREQPPWGYITIADDDPGMSGDVNRAGDLNQVAQAGTTWIGWMPGGLIGTPGVWDFDDRGLRTCPTSNNWDEYIKHGAYAQGWTSEDVYGTGDFTAIRGRSNFVNSAPCGFENCDMSGCVLTFYDPLEPGPGGVGHFAGYKWNRAWSPTIDMTVYPPRGYILSFDRYAYMALDEWIFYRMEVKYTPHSHTEWTAALSDNYAYYAPHPTCEQRMWDFSHMVPTDADSLKIGLSVWNGCVVWPVECTVGNASPVFDNVRMGVYDAFASPIAGIAPVDNYTDAFPEPETASPDAAALIDVARSLNQTGTFLRQGDSLVVSMPGANAYVELCFRVIPGPSTDLADPFFTTLFPSGSWSACSEDPSDNLFQCVRMDTAFIAGDGDTTSMFTNQTVFESRYASVFHEEDSRYATVGGEGVDILPDSLFTPGTRIYYYVRSSYLPGPGPYAYCPPGADQNDPSTLYEIEVLPDLCKTPASCLLYVDYFNRGAQGPIEEALTSLGRTWDRFDLRAESSHQGNGIGNREIGADRYRLRGPIGPSIDHLTGYGVMLINNGDFGVGTVFSDGGLGMVDDPTDDIAFLESWVNEGDRKGLWLSGNNIANDFGNSGSSTKLDFLENTLGAVLVDGSYRDLVGHSVHSDSCRWLSTRYGMAGVENYYDLAHDFALTGSSCPEAYYFDVLGESGLPGGEIGLALLYDRTDLTDPPGYYASVDHIFPAMNAPFDSVRTKIDGFSLHLMRDSWWMCEGEIAIALWLRDVLGGVTHDGYFYDRALEVQYCPPIGPENVGVPRTGQRNVYSLSQNFPNPFGGLPGTTIRYSVARPGKVELRFFDAAGREVNKIEELAAEPGAHTIVWNGKDAEGRAVPSGVYFYQIRVAGFADQKKMILVN